MRARKWTRPGRGMGQEGSTLTVGAGAEVSGSHSARFSIGVYRPLGRPEVQRPVLAGPGTRGMMTTPVPDEDMPGVG